MNYTIDTLWVLLEHLIDDIQNRCIEYDSQITFTRKKLPHFTFIEIAAIFHSTWSKDKAKTHIAECIMKATYNVSKFITLHFSPQFIIKTIYDLYELATYLELSLLWP